MGQPDRSNRLDSIDLLRGLVIVIMALDHVKGSFSNAHFDLVYLARTTPAVFLTRWITHFCAPVFVFLAGTGAFLYGARGRTKWQLSWFLLSRGLWLVVLELTVIRAGFLGNMNYNFVIGQVIWVIGLSMIGLAAFVHLPTSAVTALGVGLIVVHNSFDGFKAEAWGQFDWVWKILHTGETIDIKSGPIYQLWKMLHPGEIASGPKHPAFWPMYPLIPWIGVVFAGYGFGTIMLLEPARRRRELLGLGITLTLAFIALRYANVYGDKLSRDPAAPGPWSQQKDGLFTAFSFVNCQKYPPSLCFLLMTLGPAITALAVFEYVPASIGKPFVIFGRVPLFFYVLHWFLIRGVAILFAYRRYGHAEWLYGSPNPGPEDFGYDLWVVYLVWLLVVALLFPLCWWYAGVKRRSKAAWLSYL